MTKKVVFDLQDYNALIDKLNDLPLPFSQIEKAMQIRELLKKAQMMDIKIQQPSSQIFDYDAIKEK